MIPLYLKRNLNNKRATQSQDYLDVKMIVGISLMNFNNQLISQIRKKTAVCTMQLLCFTHICISPYVLLVSQGPKDSQPCKLYCTSTHPPELSTTMKQNLENERKKQYSKPSLRKGLPVPWIPALTAVSWLSEHPI